MGRQLQRVSGQLLHRETKSNSSDNVVLPLPDICVSALRQRKIEEDVAREAAGAAWQDGGWVITTRWGTPIEPRNFNRAWNIRCRKAGVRRITVHDGRRTCATLLVDLEYPPPGGRANPPACPDLGNHGGLRPSFLKSYPRRAQAPGRQP
jgi:integrase